MIPRQKRKFSGSALILPAALLLLALMTTVSFMHVANAQVIGIDFGSEWIKMSFVKGGQIDIVLTDQAKRKLANELTFNPKTGERMFGDDALKRTLITDELYKNRFGGVRVLTERDSALNRTVQVSFGGDGLEPVNFMPEELIAMQLGQIKQLSESYLQIGAIRDCVVAVPPYYTDAHRRAMIRAASLAGWNVLSLIQEPAALALQYGVQKRDILALNSTAPMHVLFVDYGAFTLQASVATFSPAQQEARSNKFGSKSVLGKIDMRGVRWDTTVGGHRIDLLIADYFASLFAQKTGHDVRALADSRPLTRLLREARRVKAVLTVNTEAHASVESLYDDRDFTAVVTREQVETLAEPLLARIVPQVLDPLFDDIKRQFGISKENLTGVELMGGGTRMLKVQQILRDYLGREIFRGMNTDESIALGAAYHGATLSAQVKAKSFSFTDIYPFRVGFVLSSNSITPPEQEKIRELYSNNAKLLSRKSITIPSSRTNISSEFSIKLSYLDNSDPTFISHWNISAAKTNVSISGSKIKATFLLDKNGLLEMESAVAPVEVEEELIEEVTNATATPTNFTANETANAADTTASDSAAVPSKEEEGGDSAPSETASETPTSSTTETAASETASKPAKKMVKRTRNIKLSVTRSFDDEQSPYRTMTEDEYLDASYRAEKFQRLQRRKADMAKARNELESFIYDSKDKLSSEEETTSNTTFWGYFTAAERDEFRAALNAADEWLSETDERKLTTHEMRKTLRSLREFVDKAQERLRKELKRQEEQRLEEEKKLKAEAEAQQAQQSPQEPQKEQQPPQEQPAQKEQDTPKTAPAHDEF